jgi:internalin A
VRLNLWDFGGQDIYHGSHALFLHSHAIFLIVWTPELERQTAYQEGSLSLRHRPLSYWLDYLRAFAGTDASMLIVQSQCDTRDKRRLHPPAPADDFPYHRSTEVSARTCLNLGILKAEIKEAARDRFGRRPPPPIGAGRLKVRDRLRQMLEEDQQREPAKRKHRLLDRIEFDGLCDETGGVSNSAALLDFLHHNGVVFYRPGLFGDRIILDQNWALEAIYAIFDRKKTLPLLRGYGRFSRTDLEALIWWDHTTDKPKYTLAEQKVFLGMMESCGICFRVRELPRASQEADEEEWEYVAPDLLPEWSDAQELLLGRLRDDPLDAEATASYAFLHEGILRGYLSKLGEHAKDAAIYWKYGCWLYEQTTRSQVLIEGRWDDAASEAGAGTIRLQAWGENAEGLIDSLLEALRRLPVGQAPKIEQTKRFRVHAASSSSASVVPRLVRTSPSGDPVTVSHGVSDKAENVSLNKLQIAARSELPLKGKPEIFVSYAWGDDSSETARKRAEVVDRLCETLANEGWNIIRDKNAMRSGDLISGFMKRIGLADRVIVVLSDKYLRSAYCMTELYSIYQRSLGEKEDFLRRITPIVLDDARFGTWRDRLAYTTYWRTEFEEMEKHLKDVGEMDFGLYKSMQEWHNRIADILSFINDVLCPHGFDDIVKDDFAGLCPLGPSQSTTRSAAGPLIPANVVPEHPEADRSAPVVRGSTSASAIVRLVPEDLGLTNLEIPSQPGLPPKGNPEIFVSYAWGDDSSETARKRGEVVDRLCETLANEGWNIIRDKNAMRSGDLISGFMKRIGFADHVIVVLSDKYLRSPYCMAELYGIYQRSVGEKEDLLHRIIPLPLADARFGTWRDRLVYTKYWRAEFEEMEKHFKDLGEMDFWLYKSIQEWHNRIGDMLVYLNDVLAPHVVRRFCEGRFCGLAPDVTATVLMRMLCACLLIE